MAEAVLARLKQHMKEIERFLSLKNLVRDVASMLLENGVPDGLKERLRQILLFPEVFKEKLEGRILPEMRSKTFLHSWRGAFGTSTYSEEDRMKVLKIVMEMLKLI